MRVAKEAIFEKVAQNRIVSGVELLSKAVKSTVGPHGRTVLANSENHTGGRTATKDGVTVAELIMSEDSAEDLAIDIVREAARETARLAGDGTSTSIILAEAILKETIARVSPGDNMTEITRNITLLIDDVVDNLSRKSIPVTGEMLHQVATISSNNDTELGKLIGTAYEKVGKEGVVHVKNTKAIETTCEFSDGITFEGGYSSAFQITNHKGKSCELINPWILVTDRKIESLQSMGQLIQDVIESQRPILIIGELGRDADSSFNYNIDRKVFAGANVVPPVRGHLQEEILKDIATAVGATFISDKTGAEWGMVTLADLGAAEKVIVDRKRTNIAKGEDTQALNERLDSLRSQLDNAQQEYEIKNLNDRIANLCGNVATIEVGGSTADEQKERKDRVDDAVLATKAALEEGVLAGGGIALLEEAKLNYTTRDTPNMILAADILAAALTTPFRQILINGHMDPIKILRRFDIGDSQGYNSKTGEYGNMFKLGVIDPAKVTKTALKNGGSVAVTLLMTDTIVANVREQRIKAEKENEVVTYKEYSILFGMFKFKLRA